MDPDGLHYRAADDGDRIALGTFECAGPDERVQEWIRQHALDRQLAASPSDDFRLLIFLQDSGSPVAVSAHERNFVAVGPDGDPIPGTYLVVIAIADRFRDADAPDGRPLVAAILESTLDDIRQCGRGPWVSMMVRPSNPDGQRVVERLGAVHVGASGGDDVYVLKLQSGFKER